MSCGEHIKGQNLAAHEHKCSLLAAHMHKCSYYCKSLVFGGEFRNCAGPVLALVQSSFLQWQPLPARGGLL